jgi:hypothetical protein
MAYDAAIFAQPLIVKAGETTGCLPYPLPLLTNADQDLTQGLAYAPLTAADVNLCEPIIY